MMDLFEDCRELERLAAYHRARSAVRGFDRARIVGGLFFLALSVVPFLLHWWLGRGYVVPDYRKINEGAVAVGLVLLAEGVWCAIRPSAAVELVGGLAMLALGLAGLARAAGAFREEGDPAWPAAAFGGFCLVFAASRFVSFRCALALRHSKYSEADLARLDELLCYVTRTKLKDATDIITFGVGVRDWRVLLGPGAALFVDMLSKRVLAARKEEVTFEVTGPVMLGGLFPARFRVRENTWKGSLAPAGFAKYQAWKLEEPAPAPEMRAAPEGAEAFKAAPHDFRP